MKVDGDFKAEHPQHLSTFDGDGVAHSMFHVVDRGFHRGFGKEVILAQHL